MAIDVGRVGFERDSEEFRVNTARLAHFGAALEDGVVEHGAGRIAHPVFHHIPVMQSMVEVLKSATPAFALHGEHDFHFRRPIVPGMRLLTVSRLIGVQPTKAGATMIIRSRISTHDGEEVSTQYSTCLATSETGAEAAGESAPARPEPAREGAAVTVEHKLPRDLAHRYAEAARDYSAYCLDAEAAAELGFPAPILHGMCTIGLAGSDIIAKACGGDTSRLSRLGGRFANPVLMVPGQSLTTRLWVGEAKAGKRLVAYECADKDGKLAIKNGFAEVMA